MLEVNLFGRFKVSQGGFPLTEFYSDKVRALLAYLVVEGQEPIRREVLGDLLWPRFQSHSQRVNLRRALHELKRSVKPTELLTSSRQSISLSTALSPLDFSCDVSNILAQIAFIEGNLETQNLSQAQQTLDEIQATCQNAICPGIRLDEAEDGTFGAWKRELSLSMLKRIKSLSLRVGQLTRKNRPGNLPGQIAPLIGRKQDLLRLEGLTVPRIHRLLAITGPGGIGKSRLALAFAHAEIKTFIDGIWWVELTPTNTSNPDQRQGTQQLAWLMLKALGVNPGGASNLETLLISRLQDKDSLFILDRFEPLLRSEQALEVLNFLMRLLRTCPSLTLLLTSRHKIPLTAATHIPLEGLSFPGQRHYLDQEKSKTNPQNDSKNLFIARSTYLNRGVPLSTLDNKLINKLCALLGGLPLAIELAASIHGDLPLTELVELVETAPLNLEANLLDLLPEHRSLNTLFQATWNTLPEYLQSILGQLTVFSNFFSLSAASAIVMTNETCGFEDSIQSLENLSLIAKDSYGRWYMHDLIRASTKVLWSDGHCLDYPPFKLAQYRHAAYFLTQIGKLDQEQYRYSDPDWQQILENRDDIFLAWNHAISLKDTSLLTHAVNSIPSFYRLTTPLRTVVELLRSEANTFNGSLQGSEEEKLQISFLHNLLPFQEQLWRHSAVRETCHELLNLKPSPSLRGSIFQNIGQSYLLEDDKKNAAYHFRQGLKQINNDPAIKPNMLGAIGLSYGNYHRLRGRPKLALKAFRKSLFHFNRLNNEKMSVVVSVIMAASLANLGKFAQAHTLLEACLNNPKSKGPNRAYLPTLINAGLMSLLVGDFPTAKKRLEEASTIANIQCQDREHVAILSNLAYLSTSVGNHLQAKAYAASAMHLGRNLETDIRVLSNLSMATILNRGGSSKEAIVHLNTCLELAHECKDPAMPELARSLLIQIGLDRGLGVSWQKHTLVLKNSWRKSNFFEGELDRVRLLLGLHLGLEASGDPDAKLPLKQAAEYVLHISLQLKEGEERQRFLENIPENRQLIKLLATLPPGERASLDVSPIGVD